MQANVQATTSVVLTRQRSATLDFCGLTELIEPGTTRSDMHTPRFATLLLLLFRVCNRPSGDRRDGTAWYGGRACWRECSHRTPCDHSFDHPRSVRVRRVRMLERGSCVVA